MKLHKKVKQTLILFAIYLVFAVPQLVYKGDFDIWNRSPAHLIERECNSAFRNIYIFNGPDPVDLTAKFKDVFPTGEKVETILDLFREEGFHKKTSLHGIAAHTPLKRKVGEFDDAVILYKGIGFLPIFDKKTCMVTIFSNRGKMVGFRIYAGIGPMVGILIPQDWE